MFRPLYDWVLRISEHPRALWVLAAVSFAESSFFPIPPDVMVVPMALAKRAQAYTIAAVCTVSSVLGGLAGYAIGFYLYESLGQWLIGLYGLERGAEEFHSWYAEWGTWVILIKGLTPIPYKLVTIVSGAAKFDLLVFTLASIATRGARFFIIAALIKAYGEPVRAFVEKRLDMVAWTFLIVLVGGIPAASLF